MNGDFTLYAPIIKVDAEHQTVTGHVLAANVVDLQDDFIRPEEIRDAMHRYMLESQQVDVMHSMEANPDLGVVECWQAPSDTEIGGQPVSAGDWLMTVKVGDAQIWEQVKAGELNGFSIAGRGKRVKVPKPSDVKSLAKRASTVTKAEVLAMLARHSSTKPVAATVKASPAKAGDTRRMKRVKPAPGETVSFGLAGALQKSAPAASVKAPRRLQKRARGELVSAGLSAMRVVR